MKESAHNIYYPEPRIDAMSECCIHTYPLAVINATVIEAKCLRQRQCFTAVERSISFVPLDNIALVTTRALCFKALLRSEAVSLIFMELAFSTVPDSVKSLSK